MRLPALHQGIRRTLAITAALMITPLASAATDLDDTTAYPGAPTFPTDYLWIDADELNSLPTSGTAWENMLEAAEEKTRGGNLADQDDQTNTNVLAKALIYARTGDEDIRKDVIKSVMNIRGSEDNEDGTTLALGKELIAYVLAADLVKLPEKKDAKFKAWLEEVMVKEYPSGKTLVSTHEVRPNNWGTFAGASRLAAAAYLQDEAEVARAAKIFKAWLGDRDLYSDFKFKEVDWWQYEPDYPVAINPVGATKEGHNIDGALPDDMRRGGEFSWPPPKENYVYSALQGAVAQAVLLDRLGYDVWNWEDQALLRAFTWLNEVADYPAEGDDTWQPYIINKVYGTDFETTSPTKPGKNVGWADWTHPGEEEADVEIPAECMVYFE
ncbi:alginate lyase family protein [Oceanobacter kriegii]|uniref:alginate lyase family protein n=1 Tax=Oceanobacter kriegii TaxID=64972 RepID=UPI000416F29E|nr:alginate lyase family protein [Oceanobacter kriegii]